MGTLLIVTEKLAKGSFHQVQPIILYLTLPDNPLDNQIGAPGGNRTLS